MIPDRRGVEQHLADEPLGLRNPIGGMIAADWSRGRSGRERLAMLIGMLVHASNSVAVAQVRVVMGIL